MSDWERPSLSSSSEPSSRRGGPKKKKPGRVRLVFWGVVAVAVVGFGWVSWSAYRSSQNIEDAGMVPLLKADNTPSRIRPDDPGGMNVPNQDKQIYDRIDPKRATPQGVERLLPAPEQPVGRPAIPALHTDDGSDGAREVSTPTVKAIPEPPAPKAVPPSQQIPSPFTKVELPPTPPKGQPAKAPAAEKPAPQPQQQAAATPPSAPAARPAPSTAPISGVKIQLAAVSSEDAAQKEWDRLKRSTGGLLDSVNPSFVRANVGDKVVYRIQAGPLASADAAADLCSKLKARNVGCFVAR